MKDFDLNYIAKTIKNVATALLIIGAVALFAGALLLAETLLK